MQLVFIQVMARAIDFDNQLGAMDGEIGDVGTHRDLATDM